MTIARVIRVVKNYLTDSDYRFLINTKYGLNNKMPDEEFLKKLYKIKLGKKLDLENPKTMNEKIQWLKLYDRKPEYTMMADKVAVRDYIAKTIGEEYLIPCLGVWDDPDDIDFDALPNKFVLKCNHNSGLGMYICKDKSQMDIKSVKKALRKGLKQDYYIVHREWPYKDVPRKIIAEQYMQDNSGALVDYKFYCFNGKADYVLVCLDRHLGDTKFYFFNRDWKLQPFNIRGKNASSDFTVRKPECMDKMFEIAETLSKGMKFIRVDLYECNNKIYFGELTFYPSAGFDTGRLPETDLYFGSQIDLTI